MEHGKKVPGDGRFPFKSKEWIQSQYTPRYTHETEKDQKTFVLRLVVVPVFIPPRISSFPLFVAIICLGKGKRKKGQVLIWGWKMRSGFLAIFENELPTWVTFRRTNTFHAGGFPMNK